ncbi:sugar phosphate isomerase/epimerase [candidate division KSB1 bacterium]|nr:sugar phosphate isomerase/epimerase [candidate division KSB1 bacterium]
MSSVFPLRLGAPVFAEWETAEQWTAVVKEQGYGAAYCPIGPEASEKTVTEYEKAAREADIIIAEVGAWSNPISPDDVERKKALEKCITHLALADRIGANCCVNVSGSRGEEWAGHHKDNLTPATFDLIIETTRKIIDAVKPTRTFFTLETMPWAYPDSVDSYVKLYKAIDRKKFAVHMDPVNLVNSPQRYYSNAALIRDFFKQLGAHIKSCHAKDILLQQNLTTHLDEVLPGAGALDYGVYLSELAKIGHVPLMIEHLNTEEEYRQAAENIRKTAHKMNIQIK